MNYKWEVKIKQYSYEEYKSLYKAITLETNDISYVQELKDAIDLFTAPYRMEIEVNSVEVGKCSED